MLKENDCLVPPHLKGEITATNLEENRGKWHKTCSLKYNQKEIDRKVQQKQRSRLSTTSAESEKRSSKRQKTDKFRCIFCDTGNELDPNLHNCTTFSIDENIRKMATEMEDTTLMSKISLGGSDLIALESKYHKQCYTAYYNSYCTFLARPGSEKRKADKDNEKQVFQELLSEMTLGVQNGNYEFYLNDLYKTYVNRLADFGIESMKNVTVMKD